jgi:hypothetical protein
MACKRSEPGPDERVRPARPGWWHPHENELRGEISSIGVGLAPVHGPNGLQRGRGLQDGGKRKYREMVLAVSRDELAGGPTKGVSDPLSKG